MNDTKSDERYFDWERTAHQAVHTVFCTSILFSGLLSPFKSANGYYCSILQPLRGQSGHWKIIFFSLWYHFCMRESHLKHLQINKGISRCTTAPCLLAETRNEHWKVLEKLVMCIAHCLSCNLDILMVICTKQKWNERFFQTPPNHSAYDLSWGLSLGNQMNCI